MVGTKFAELTKKIRELELRQLYTLQEFIERQIIIRAKLEESKK